MLTSESKFNSIVLQTRTNFRVLNCSSMHCYQQNLRGIVLKFILIQHPTQARPWGVQRDQKSHLFKFEPSKITFVHRNSDDLTINPNIFILLFPPLYKKFQSVVKLITNLTYNDIYTNDVFLSPFLSLLLMNLLIYGNALQQFLPNAHACGPNPFFYTISIMKYSL